MPAKKRLVPNYGYKHKLGGGEGVQIFKNEAFVDGKAPLASGQYTYKQYMLGSKIPAAIRILLPKALYTIREEAWNSYPYCKTIYTVLCCSIITNQERIRWRQV